MSAPKFSRRPPLWMIIVIIVAMLPLLAFPALLSAMDSVNATTRTFICFYPLYVVISGVCAWICWPERKEVCWILIILMFMSHAAMWMLAKGL